MFGNREKRDGEAMQAEIEPFRQMAATFEVQDRLDAIDIELALVDRHLLTSNDRYQMSAAYLQVARNRFILVDSIATSLFKIDGEETKGQLYNRRVITDFLLNGYQEVKANLEVADEISAIPGFVSDKKRADHLKSNVDTTVWPQPEQISGRFVRGSLDGLRSVYAYVFDQYTKADQDKDVPNIFKYKLREKVQSQLTTASNKQKAIERISGPVFSIDCPPVVLHEIYEDVIEAMHALESATLWLTMPRLLDRSFELSDPFNENQPERRSFSPSGVISRVIQTATETPKPATPSRPVGRPFSPNALQASRPSRQFNNADLAPPAAPKPPAGPQKPFNPATLNSPKTETPKDTPKRSFDPDSLKAPRPKKHFDPRDTKNEK